MIFFITGDTKDGLNSDDSILSKDTVNMIKNKLNVVGINGHFPHIVIKKVQLRGQLNVHRNS